MISDNQIDVLGRTGPCPARPLPDAHDLLLAFSFVAIDDDIVEAAMNEPDLTSHP